MPLDQRLQGATILSHGMWPMLGAHHMHPGYTFLPVLPPFAHPYSAEQVSLPRFILLYSQPAPRSRCQGPASFLPAPSSQYGCVLLHTPGALVSSLPLPMVLTAFLSVHFIASWCISCTVYIMPLSPSLLVWIVPDSQNHCLYPGSLVIAFRVNHLHNDGSLPCPSSAGWLTLATRSDST